MPNAFDARDPVFDGLGDLAFQLGGRGAELCHGHGDYRNVRRRQAGYRELGEAHPAQDQEDDRKHDGRKRIPDRPGRDIECHQRVRRSSSSANVVLIWSPSCSELPASATTISPTSRPSRISVEVSDTSPTLTFRVSTVFPLIT